MSPGGRSLAEDRSWVEGLAEAAARVLPPSVAAYLEAGAGEQVTRDEAHTAWQRHRLLPRVLQGADAVDTSLSILGSRLATPVGIAPTSMQMAAHPDGEVAMARGAAAAGALHVVSSNAGGDLEQIGGCGPWWAQVYLPPRRADALEFLRAVRRAGASAVVLTADTPFPGPKYDVADGDWDGIDRSWHRRHLPPGEVPWARDLRPGDVGWLGDAAELPVVVKGVLRPDDAVACVDAGAAAVWVSNHGGRQLDRAVATADALADAAAAVAGRVPLLVDGGVRSGLDVLVALALGADAVMLGRLPFRALAAGGEAAVTRLLDVLTAELRDALALAGAGDAAGARGTAVPARGAGHALSI